MVGRLRGGRQRPGSGPPLTRIVQQKGGGHRLGFGPPTTETAVRSVGGVGMVTGLSPGDHVSLHWEWVCDRLTDQQMGRLRRYT